MLQEPAPVFLRRVPGSNGHVNRPECHPLPVGDGPHAGQRRPQVAFDVDGQRLER